ncbi:MAG: hypothetical protein HRT35_30530 [Algicola sp.]|nr:hypothetical protein [Algicola sp.]
MTFFEQNIEVPVFLLFLILIGILQVVKSYSSKGRCKKAFKKNLKAKLTECNDGIVSKVQGDIQLCHAPINALCSNNDCAAFSVWMEEEYTADSNRGLYEQQIPLWRVIASKEQATDFLLKQDDAFALVCTDSAFFVWQRVLQFEKMTTNNENPAIVKKAKYLLKESGVLPHTFVHQSAGYRCKEAVLAPGEQVVVCGQGHWQSIDDFDYLRFLAQQGIEKILVFRHNDKNPLYISQDNAHLKSYR